jgi:hypothetical protein
MVVRRGRDVRTDFGFGQVPEEILATDDDLLNASCKAALNAFPADTGNMIRRCGSSFVTSTSQTKRSRLVRREDGEQRIVAMRSGSLVVYRLDGTVELSVSAPWTDLNVRTMTVTDSEEAIYFAHESFMTKKLEYKNGAWSFADVGFEVYPDGAIAHPYHRFEDDGVTVQSSGTSGSVTLTFSSAVLTADHVGTRIQIYDQDVEITSVSGVTAGATIIGTLYPTYRVTVPSPLSYSVGDVVSGGTSQIRGEVVNVDASYVYVANTQGYDNFDVAGTEDLIGPRSTQAISASISSTPGPTVRWREQMMSPARGYPRTVAFFSNRLVFAGFRDAPTYMAASASGIPGDFRIISDVQDGDPFIVGITASGISEIRHLVASELLLIFTRTGSWYVPQGRGVQFTPTAVDFDRLQPEGASEIQPVEVDSGVAIIDTNERLVIYELLGTQVRSWGTRDISVLSEGVLKTPVDLTYVNGIAPRKEKAICVLNSDGTVALLVRRRGENIGGGNDIAGWVPWEAGLDAEFTAFAAEAGAFYGFIRRSDTPYDMMVLFEWDAVMDAEISYKTPLTDGIGETMHVRRDTAVINVGEVASDGEIPNEPPAVDQTVGIDFDVTITPSSGRDQQVGQTLMHLNEVFVDVITSGGFYGNGEWRSSAPFDADLETIATPTTRIEHFYCDGWDAFKDFTISQIQGQGDKLQVRSVTYKESRT